MNLDSFATLVELQSYHKQTLKLLKDISLEEERILSLQKRRQEKELFIKEQTLLLEKLKAEIQAQEKLLFEKEELLRKAHERQKTASTELQCKAIEKELEVFLPQKEKLENDIYALLERQEELKAERDEAQGFLQGSEKTLSEIQVEVEKSTSVFKKNLSVIQGHMAQSLELSPPEVQGLWKELVRKFPKDSQLSFIESGVCGECRCNVGRNIENLIEKGGTVEFCPQCKRLLTPQKRV